MCAVVYSVYYSVLPIYSSVLPIYIDVNVHMCVCVCVRLHIRANVCRFPSTLNFINGMGWGGPLDITRCQEGERICECIRTHHTYSS